MESLEDLHILPPSRRSSALDCQRCGTAISQRRPPGASGGLREAVPNINLQMLLRGHNTVGYTPCPEKVTRAFVQEAADTGIFGIFDALNNIDQMRPAIEAVRETGTTVGGIAISYTGDLANPGETLYTLDYYLHLAEEIGEAGAPHPCHQGHGRTAPGTGRYHTGDGAAQQLQPVGATCTPTTPWEDSSPPTSPRGKQESTP